MKKKEMLTIILIVVIAAAMMYFTGMGCPILKMTGIPCFGCGMTRACISLFHLDFAAALYYHPMVFLIPACIVALLLTKKMPKPMIKGIVITVVALFVVVYLFRLFDPENTVVKWNVENGVIYQLLTK